MKQNWKSHLDSLPAWLAGVVTGVAGAILIYILLISPSQLQSSGFACVDNVPHKWAITQAGFEQVDFQSPFHLEEGWMVRCVNNKIEFSFEVEAGQFRQYDANMDLLLKSCNSSCADHSECSTGYCSPGPGKCRLPGEAQSDEKCAPVSQ